jgi:hypothetical protein
VNKVVESQMSKDEEAEEIERMIQSIKRGIEERVNEVKNLAPRSKSLDSKSSKKETEIKEAEIIERPLVDSGLQRYDIDDLLDKFIGLRVDQALIPPKNQENYKTKKVNKQLDNIYKKLSSEVQALLTEEAKTGDAHARVREMLTRGLKRKFRAVESDSEFLRKRNFAAGRQISEQAVQKTKVQVDGWVEEIMG